MAVRKKVEGLFIPLNENVSFNGVWENHVFTDDEVQQLLAGDKITFFSVNKWGNPISVTGSLQHYVFKGRQCFGFQLDENAGIQRVCTYRM